MNNIKVTLLNFTPLEVADIAISKCYDKNHTLNMKSKRIEFIKFLVLKMIAECNKLKWRVK